MNKKSLLLIASIMFCASWDALANPIESVVLNEQSVKGITKQCSRDVPVGIEGTWRPSKEDIANLESRLHLISNLDAHACCSPGSKVVNIERYKFQYSGVTIQGRKQIYINAFDHDASSENWDHEPIIWCDGGLSFWGALYDVETMKLHSLAINGEA